jgi:predicted RNase H-like HicB family nuclease
MRYPIAIERGSARHAWGVAVPDLAGCFSAGDTLDEAISNASDAIVAWLEEHVERIGAPPPATPIEVLQRDRRWRGWIWAFAEVDGSRITDRTERINITISRRLLRRVDAYAKRMGESRSGLLARGALEVMGAAPQPGRKPARRPRR